MQPLVGLPDWGLPATHPTPPPLPLSFPALHELAVPVWLLPPLMPPVADAPTRVMEFTAPPQDVSSSIIKALMPSTSPFRAKVRNRLVQIVHSVKMRAHFSLLRSCASCSAVLLSYEIACTFAPLVTRYSNTLGLPFTYSSAKQRVDMRAYSFTD